MEETEAANVEYLQAEMKRDIRSWGLALLVLGIIHIVLSGFLDPLWGGILVVIGVLCLLIRRRAMYVVIGTALILVGVMNILFTGFGGWTILGVFQLGFGIHQIRNFRKYGNIQHIGTRSEEPVSSTSYREASVGEHKVRKKLLIGLGAVIAIVIIGVILGIPTRAVEPERPIPSHFATYTDDTGRFSVSYPQDWEPALSLIEQVDQGTIVFLAGVPNQGGVFPGFNIVVEPLPLIMRTHNALVTAQIEGIKAAFPDYHELSRVRTTVDGRTATILVWQGTLPYTATCRYVTMMFSIGGTGWYVTCVTVPDEYWKWEDDFDAIVRSLRILK